MGGQRAPVRSTLGGALRSQCRGRGVFGCFVSRDALLDLLEAKQKLVLGQRLGASAEAMTLQFLDDLHKALGAQTLGDQHRLQRAGIVGRRVGHQVHAGSESLPHAGGNRFAPLRSARYHRHPSIPHRTDAAPVEAFQQCRELRGRQVHGTVLNLWPAELTVLQPLGHQYHAGAVPEYQLDPIGALGPEDVDRPRERIGAHRLADQVCQPLGTFAEVDGLGRHHHSDGAGRTDHTPTFRALITVAIDFGLASDPTPTTTPPSSSSIPPPARVAPRLRRRGFG